MRDFRKYQIWQSGINLVKLIYSFSNSLPDNEKYGIISQIKRAAVSIPSNIAEGCSRYGSDDFKRFLEIALGSAFELETQIIIIKDVFNVDVEDANTILNELNELQKSLNSLITKIKSSNTNG